MRGDGIEAYRTVRQRSGRTDSSRSPRSAAVPERSVEERIRSFRRDRAERNQGDRQAVIALKLTRHGVLAVTGLALSTACFVVMNDLAAPHNRVWWFFASVVALALGLVELVALLGVAFGGTHEMQPDERSVTRMDRVIGAIVGRLAHPIVLKEAPSRSDQVLIVSIIDDRTQSRERSAE